MGRKFKLAPKHRSATREEARIWDRVGFIFSGVRREKDLYAAEAAAWALTGVTFIAGVWDPRAMGAAHTHLELLRWDLVKSDVWVIYRRVADAGPHWIDDIEASVNTGS